ncbi:MAG: hypothetical protein UT32_C0002G0047 [Parcubacteria group bacterium GW2011_GWC2_39_14]|nr:MAG: hypothetical protein UT32_C0002G0047 [Parcubacteria group bacterium GW2011_GWC2_39_14]KKR55272.1 MAG: hypothetical protein UT91_C0003G0047 [Parcubacteria group bacterium GW2011_GWA2_40_23]
MKKVLIYFLLLSVFWCAGVAYVSAATAQDIAKGGLDATNAKVGLAEGDPATTIGAALGVLLNILSLIFLIICVYAGVTWMTASGEKDNIAKARSMLIQGSIGLAVTLAAYAFTAFVVDRISTAVIK